MHDEFGNLDWDVLPTDEDMIPDGDLHSGDDVIFDEDDGLDEEALQPAINGPGTANR